MPMRLRIIVPPLLRRPLVFFFSCDPVPEKLTLLEPEVRLLRERGQSVRLQPLAHDAQGQLLVEPRLIWSSTAPEVVTVENGVVTARRSGRATIHVSGGQARASTSFVVSIPGKLVLQAGNGSFIEVGRQERLTVTVLDELGKRIRHGTAEWSSSDERIARIAAGMVVGVAPGNAVLTATLGGLRQELPILVMPAIAQVSIEPGSHTSLRRGQELQLQAKVRDSRGKPLEGVPVHWFTSNNSVVRISSSGKVTAVRPGRALISCSAGRRVGTAEFIVP
jgi:hypothetical protein